MLASVLFDSEVRRNSPHALANFGIGTLAATLSQRLYEPRIERSSKRVIRSPGFKDQSGAVKPGSVLEGEVNLLIDCFSKGLTVPDRFYRSGIDRDEDELLDTLGVVHLHLGGKGSDELLFLVQYPDRIVLLEINSHIHFATDPKGKLLRSLHDQHLAAIEEDQRREAAAAAEEKDRSIAGLRRAAIARKAKPEPPSDGK